MGFFYTILSLMTEISETSNQSQGTVLYDAACGMCLATMARLRPLLEPRGFRFEPFPAGAEKVEMKLHTADGHTLGGADCLLAMARALWWLRPLAILTIFPGVMPLLRLAYRKIAANRHCISGACGWAPPVITA
jgi:predicted DCC family thiol-disulfide oxidoreductase YuxK